MNFFVKKYKNWKTNAQFTQIDSDPEIEEETEMNETHSLNSEKQSIRDSAKSLKKYGSTCNHVRNNEVLIRHEVEKEDTLQGIALKYGCTTEQIRRANRLFASDSLFLRQLLMIPVEKDSPYYPKDENNRPQSLPPRAATISGFPSSPQAGSSKSQSMDSMVLSPEEENKKSIDDFLGKIDSTIAETKKYVAQSQRSIDLDDSDLTMFKKKHSNNRNGDAYGNSISSSSAVAAFNPNRSRYCTTENGSEYVPMTQGRHVQYSLRKLERQQDEFFQL